MGNGSDQRTPTALDGGVSFSRLEPGQFNLFGSLLGYEPAQRRIDVVANEVARVDITLEAIVVFPPRSEVLSYTGYVQCRLATTSSTVACGFLPVVGDAGCLAGPAYGLLPKVWTNNRNELLFQLTGPDYSQIVFEASWTRRPDADKSFVGGEGVDVVFVFQQRITHYITSFYNAHGDLNQTAIPTS